MNILRQGSYTELGKSRSGYPYLGYVMEWNGIPVYRAGETVLYEVLIELFFWCRIHRKPLLFGNQLALSSSQATFAGACSSGNRKALATARAPPRKASAKIGLSL